MTDHSKLPPGLNRIHIFSFHATHFFVPPPRMTNLFDDTSHRRRVPTFQRPQTRVSLACPQLIGTTGKVNKQIPHTRDSPTNDTFIESERWLIYSYFIYKHSSPEEFSLSLSRFPAKCSGHLSGIPLHSGELRVNPNSSHWGSLGITLYRHN